MKLLLTRHGQSRWQVEGDSAGGDAPLTSLGELQAHRLGEYLSTTERLDRIFCSSLCRASRTAEIIASYLNLPVTPDPDLREFEDWLSGYAPYPASPWALTPLSTETSGYLAFQNRVVTAARRALETAGTSNARVLIVAHGGTVGTMLRAVFGAPALRIWTGNTALHALDWNGECWTVHYLNRMEHLPEPLRSW